MGRSPQSNADGNGDGGCNGRNDDGLQDEETGKGKKTTEKREKTNGYFRRKNRKEKGYKLIQLRLKKALFEARQGAARPKRQVFR